MPATVTLTVTQGKLTGQKIVFDERTTCIIGRSPECHPQIPNDEAHRTISRHHCLLDINPPDIRVRDFGSLNGTFVNGEKIGQRDTGHSPAQARDLSFSEYDLKEGDTVKLGGTVFTVSVYIPEMCRECGTEIPENLRKPDRIEGEQYQCPVCAEKARNAERQPAVKPASSAHTPRMCAVCGKNAPQEIGRSHHDERMCAACRNDPMKIIHWLLKGAKQGKQELVEIQGYTILKELGKGGMGPSILRGMLIADERWP